MSGYDIGASASTTSGAQSGQATSGSFSVTGGNSVPVWVWIGLGVIGFLVIWKKVLKF